MSRRTALITGGSRGIGLGIATALAESGFDLVINGIRKETEVTPVLNSLRQLGGKVVYAQGNIGLAADREGILNTALSAFQRIEVLVNNAGVAPAVRADVLEMTEESYDRVMGINLKGTFFLTRHIARYMEQWRASDHGYTGSIITISSISAEVASVNRGEYCMAKAGLGMMTKLLAARMGNAGIPVYEVRPGVIKTDMTAQVTEKYDKLINEGLILEPRWGTPEDIGKIVKMLAIGDLPYATGQVIYADGGMHVMRL